MRIHRKEDAPMADSKQLDSLFSGRDPVTREIYEKLLASIARLGPF